MVSSPSDLKMSPLKGVGDLAIFNSGKSCIRATFRLLFLHCGPLVARQTSETKQYILSSGLLGGNDGCDST